MAEIAAIIADMFEDVEYTEPVKAFREEGHKIINVGLSAGQTVKGKKKGTPVKIDVSVSDAQVKDFDALLIPGGYSPDKLRKNEDAVIFAGNFVMSGKPVFAICYGPLLLISAGVLQERSVTGYKSIIQDIKNAGAEFVDSEVVIDNNIVSSRDPSDMKAFIRESLDMLKAATTA